MSRTTVQPALSGTTSPSTVPVYIGQMYVDTQNKVVYIAT